MTNDPASQTARMVDPPAGDQVPRRRLSRTELLVAVVAAMGVAGIVLEANHGTPTAQRTGYDIGTSPAATGGSQATGIASALKGQQRPDWDASRCTARLGGPNRDRSARTPSRTRPGLNGQPPSPAAVGRTLTG